MLRKASLPPSTLSPPAGLRPRHDLGSLQPVWGYDIAHYLAMVCKSIKLPRDAVVVTIDKTLRARAVTAVLENGTPLPAEGGATVSIRVSVGATTDFSAANSKETWGNDIVVRWKSDLAGLLYQMTSPPGIPDLAS
ncbi:hypothetical protein MFIFM68171_00883 [Madurella fahalii]|uniref:Uncharacterized protein n=1 Tax=Madurella fahalii TaxID=1157608 RepID=A0ABQ0FYW0_9PEZI